MSAQINSRRTTYISYLGGLITISIRLEGCSACDITRPGKPPSLHQETKEHNAFCVPDNKISYEKRHVATLLLATLCACAPGNEMAWCFNKGKQFREVW